MEVSLQIPLGEQLHLKEMFAMMEENHMDGQIQGMEEFLQFFDQMERHFGDMQEELNYLHEQLDHLNDKKLKAKLDDFVQSVGERTHTAKIWVAALKEDASKSIQSAVEEAKYHGAQGLYKILDQSKISKALAIIHEHLEKSAEKLKSGIQKLDAASAQLQMAKQHKKNAHNLLMGRDAVEVVGDVNKGIFAKIKTALECCKKIIVGMEKRSKTMQESLHHFSQKALGQREEREAAMVPDKKKAPEAVVRGKAR